MSNFKSFLNDFEIVKLVLQVAQIQRVNSEYAMRMHILPILLLISGVQQLIS